MTNLSPDLANAKRLAKMQDVATSRGFLEGVGYAADDRIKVEARASEVLSGLTPDSRVMRMDSPGLAEAIFQISKNPPR